MASDPKPAPRIDEDGVPWCTVMSCPVTGCHMGEDNDPGDICLPAVRALAVTAKRRLDLLAEAYREIQRTPREFFSESKAAIRAELRAADRLDANGRVK